MLRSAVALLFAGAALACCSRSPQDQQAEAVKSAAAKRADQIDQQSRAQAESMHAQAKTLSQQAKQAGGLTGQRLQVQADALDKQADIVSRQGKLQAEATREAADAQAKQLASR